MENSFNVISDPWITVKYLDGLEKKIGVRDIFKDAHLISEIEEYNFEYEYGIFNFLCVLVYSVYGPKDLDEKVELIKQGFFNIENFDKYIKKCEQNRPNCFNLFGENPLFQNINIDKRKAFQVGKIALDIPSGNNILHFASDKTINKALTFEETAKALCSYYLFQSCVDGRSGSPSGPNGLGYPEYFVFSFENLFQDLVFNIITENTWKHIMGEDAKYKGNAIWEINPDFSEKESTQIVSLVEGLTFQNRFVLLNSVKNQLVENIYFRPGRRFEKLKTILNWKQPNSPYYTLRYQKNNKEISKYTSLSLNGFDKIWLNLPIFFRDLNNVSIKDNYSIETFSEYLKIKKRISSNVKSIKYNIYYISLNGGQYPPYQKGKYSSYIPLDLVEDKLKYSHFSNVLEFITEIGRYLKSDIVTSGKSYGKPKKIVSNLTFLYYDTLELTLLPEIISQYGLLKLSDNTKENDEILTKLDLEIIKEAKKLLLNIYNDNVLSCFNNQIYTIDKDKDIKVGFYGKINDEKKKILGAIKIKQKERGLMVNEES